MVISAARRSVIAALLPCHGGAVHADRSRRGWAPPCHPPASGIQRFRRRALDQIWTPLSRGVTRDDRAQLALPAPSARKRRSDRRAVAAVAVRFLMTK